MPSALAVPLTAPAQLYCGFELHAPAWTGFQLPVIGQAITTIWPAFAAADSWAGGNSLLTLAVRTGAASSEPSWKRTAAMATGLASLPEIHKPLAGTLGGGGRGAPSGWPCHQYPDWIPCTAWAGTRDDTRAAPARTMASTRAIRTVCLIAWTSPAAARRSGG